MFHCLLCTSCRLSGILSLSATDLLHISNPVTSKIISLTIQHQAVIQTTAGLLVDDPGFKNAVYCITAYCLLLVMTLGTRSSAHADRMGRAAAEN